jgi:hypothetical protein
MKTPFILLSAMLSLAAPASAAVIGGAVTGGVGSFVELDGDATFSVGKNNFDTDALYAFNETQNFVLTDDLVLELGMSPLMAGTRVSSHYVFFDPLRLSEQQGYVDFDGDILGVATTTATLKATDALISNSVTYLSPKLRGLERRDSVEIDQNNANRLLLDWRAGSPGDYVRVFTAANLSANLSVVPLPAGGALLLSGLVGFAGLRRFKRG